MTAKFTNIPWPAPEDRSQTPGDPSTPKEETSHPVPPTQPETAEPGNH
ncbi:hypothetical protein [Streptomyces yaizuensis]|uniref:Uncharacterized protein n=1 Tax=Streptomyces yaizuensis TaxID=2989713 RepID=A0ABQ5P6K8_9ACTN|nr:hypothetical protein [Streptomyces sp. YSPA8]GLF98216.1 hypothetical protein SYYSPA8_27985 [Streptomyces sp. YSPA8]